MTAQSTNLHGAAPDKSNTVLLLIDVINAFDFPGNEPLLAQTGALARCLDALRVRARKAGIPSLYVNDNFGRWQSNFELLIRHCLSPKSAGRKFVRRLAPRSKDYVVIKPKHSGFYSTTLEVLLNHLGARRLILTGIAGNICVLFTANDAYMRGFELIIPADGVISNTVEENHRALEFMRKILKADTRPTTDRGFVL